MGRYKVNNDGTLGAMISGRGKAEYGASTVRTGSVSVTGIPKVVNSVPSYKEVNITFDTPMPDADYELETSVNYQAFVFTAISNKTANGFRAVFTSIYPTSDIDVTFTYTAFKLYTDTEYNELLDANNWKYISCTKTEVGVSAVQAALSQTPPANMKEFYIEFEIAGGKLYTFFAPKGGDANLINALNNPQYHCYAYGTIMSNNTLQCTMTSKGTGYSSYPLYVTGMYYR